MKQTSTIQNKAKYWLIATIFIIIVGSVYGYSYYAKKHDVTGGLIHATEHELKQMERDFYKQNKENLDDKEFVKKKIALLDQMDYKVRHDVYYAARDNQTTYNYDRVKKYYKERNDKITVELTKILDYYIWPTISEFGSDAEYQAWHIVYNAYKNPTLQYRTLGVYAPLNDMGEVNSRAYYYLYDRTALNMDTLGVKQKYGTQYTKKDDKTKLLPYQGTLLELNARRLAVGLSVVVE